MERSWWKWLRFFCYQGRPSGRCVRETFGGKSGKSKVNVTNPQENPTIVKMNERQRTDSVEKKAALYA